MAYIDDVYLVVNIAPVGIPTYVRLSQNENGRRLYFAVTGGEIPSGSTATMSGTKPDGAVYSKAGTISGNTVTFNEDIQLTAVAGEWPAKIVIVNGGQTVMTARIRFVIDADTVAAGAVPSDSQLEGLVAQAAAYAEAAKDGAFYGSPLVASTVAEMTDKTRVYVYTGSESGYTSGNWYYWSGSAWTSGGVYNATAVSTDTTLSIAGKAADAKATGDAIAAVTIPTDKTLTVSDAPADAKVVGDELAALKDDLFYDSNYTIRNDNLIKGNITSLLSGGNDIVEENDEYLNMGNFLLGEDFPSDYHMHTGFIDNSADNDPTVYYDSSTYTINICRFNSNKEYVSQTGYITIQPIRIRAYLTDPYIRIVIKRKDEEKIDNADRANIRIYTKKTVTNSLAYKSDLLDLQYLMKTNVITVKKDGTGDYTTLKSALASISNNSFYNRYVVEIYEGTYDLKEEYSAEWGESGFIGCTVPPFVKLKGVGARENIIITAEDTTTDQSIRILMATINLHQSSELENLTVKGEGLKYTVHDDFDSEKLDGYREITDVTVMGDNPLTSAIWGAGAWARTKTRFKNCLFSSNNKVHVFYMHNNTSAKYPSYIEFVNCRFKSYNTSFGSCRLFLSTANNPNHAECYCTIIGSKVRSIYMSTEGTATTIDWKVTGFSNETDGATITVEGYESNVDLIATAEYSRYSDGAY